MEEELLSKSYNNMEKNNFLSNEIKTYIKKINNDNIHKNNIFFMDIIFIHVNRIYDIYQFKKIVSNNILNLSSTQPDESIALFIIPIPKEDLLDDYINILLKKDMKKRNFITYFEFLNFNEVPMYLFDEEFLIKYNINIGSNIDIFKKN